MSGKPNLYDQFDEKSLSYWEAQVRSGKLPTREQLADLVEANASQRLPCWLIFLIAGTLRGQLKGKPGRRKQTPLRRYQFAAAAYEYELLLRQMQKHPDKSASEPPHARAAQQVIKDWKLAMDWRSFLNQISSEK